MFAAILNLLFFFGGILFYILDLATFRVAHSDVPRILYILKFCIACIPVVGSFVTLGIYIAKIIFHRKDAVCKGEILEPVVRDNAINRFLFNDVDWSTYTEKITKKS